MSLTKGVKFKAIRAIAVGRCIAQLNKGGLTVEKKRKKSAQDGWNEVALGGNT
jgi:hypothetical protein